MGNFLRRNCKNFQKICQFIDEVLVQTIRDQYPQATGGYVRQKAPSSGDIACRTCSPDHPVKKRIFTEITFPGDELSF